MELEPKVSAVGAGLDIFKPFGNMVIDIGGGTSDIAFLSLGDIVASRSLKIAGDRLNMDILNFVKKKYNLQIGERTAEKVKIEIGTVVPGHRNEEIDVRGRDTVSGLPRTITLKSDDVEPTLNETMMNVVEAAKDVLGVIPPELAADIIDHGIMMTGGGALLDGMDQLLMDNLNIPVNISDTPLDDVAVGTGILLEKILGSENQKG